MHAMILPKNIFAPAKASYVIEAHFNFCTKFQFQLTSTSTLVDIHTIDDDLCCCILFQPLPPSSHSKCCRLKNSLECWVYEIFFTYPIKKTMVKRLNFYLIQDFQITHTHTLKFQIFRFNAFQWDIISLYFLFLSNSLSLNFITIHTTNFSFVLSLFCCSNKFFSFPKMKWRLIG